MPRWLDVEWCVLSAKLLAQRCQGAKLLALRCLGAKVLILWMVNAKVLILWMVNVKVLCVECYGVIKLVDYFCLFFDLLNDEW